MPNFKLLDLILDVLIKYYKILLYTSSFILTILAITKLIPLRFEDSELSKVQGSLME